MDSLALALPVAFVADDVLEVFIALDVIGTDDIGSVPDDLLGNARLSCYLNGERAARSSDGKPEERFHEMTVVEHGTVGDMVVAVGEVFKILIVSGYDGPRALLPQLLQHALGDGTANLWLGTGAELVDEDKGAVGGLLHHILHII